MESSRNGGQTSIGGKCRLGVNVHPSLSSRGGIRRSKSRAETVWIGSLRSQ
jgi:hypothetical protein